MKIKLHKATMPLEHPFGISREVKSEQISLIVELQQEGVSGFGEAPEDTFYGKDYDSLAVVLKSIQPELEALTDWTPESAWEQFAPVLSNNRFAQCALDEAMWDLHGKLQGERLFEMWGGGNRVATMPQSSYTIGIDTIPKMIEKLHERPDWTVYKIKLGCENDIEMVRALRQETDAPFYVDANCAWTVEETIEKSKQLRDLNTVFIEQPLLRENREGLKEVFQKSALPIIADESCQTEADVEDCKDHFHGVNIKLVKCGGLTPARRMIEKARSLDLKLMVGCMTESSVGISASAQLLPWLDYADVDGAVLLATDIATGVRVENGTVTYSEEHGSGVQMLPSTTMIS